MGEARVAAGRDDDAGVPELTVLDGGELAVEGAARLEHATVLEVLALEPQSVAAGRCQQGSATHASGDAVLGGEHVVTGDRHVASIASPPTCLGSQHIEGGR